MDSQIHANICQMTRLEMDALFRFIKTYSDTADRIHIAEVINSTGKKTNTIELLHRISKRKDFQYLKDDMVITLMKLSDVIKLLYDKGHHSLAERLYCCYLECQRNTSILRVNKAQTENRRKISLYFKNIKKLVHEFAFKNPHVDVRRLGDIMKQNIKDEKDVFRKMFLCDKYTALKAAEMDALINVTGAISPEHEGYQEMESFINSTSNPSLSQVILYGRKADVMSTFGRFEEGEELLRAAYVSADFSAPCVEITDMIYKKVVFKLSELEKYPSSDIQKSLIFEASRGMKSQRTCEYFGNDFSYCEWSFVF